ncbi:flagellar motor protein [Bacillaceae bacterium]
MDLTTIIGLIVGILSLVIGFILEGGHLSSLFQVTAALIVFGGTLGAVIASFPVRVLKKIPYILKIAFKEKAFSPEAMIDKLVEFSYVSRREGLLALEEKLSDVEEDDFLYEGVQMVIDGVEPELVREILDTEIELYESRHMEIARVFEVAGGFAPTMGIIGTVMGLVHVLGNLSDPGSLGPAIAMAFIATLYGVASANVIYFPIFNKIKARVQQDVLLKELQAEGILSIQQGENPNILRKKLLAFLDAELKGKVAKDGRADGGEEAL